MNVANRDLTYSTHILECIGKIEKWHSEGKQVFVDDDKTQAAIIRNLQIMAESTKRLSEKVKQNNIKRN